MSHEIACAVCGEPCPPWSGRGRKPKYCVEHRVQKNRARDSRKAASTGDPAALERLASLGYAEPPRMVGAELEVFAVWLGAAKGDPETAARLAGIDASGPALEAMVTDAKERHPGLVAGKVTAGADIAQTARTLLFLRLRQNASTLDNQQLGPAIKQLTDSLSTITGGDGAVYTEITCELHGPSAKDIAEWQKKTGADVALLGVEW